MKKRKQPSDFYQYKFNEIGIDSYEKLFMPCCNNDCNHSDDYESLNEAAIKRLFEIGCISMTNYQTNIINMLRDGYTQREIADAVGLVQQSSITKILRGDRSFTNGGLYKRLRSFLAVDVQFRDIISKMIELGEYNDD